MRRNPPAKWVLPETVNPVARRCIQVQVPDDPMYIAAFRGAMLMLASAYNWADDPTHKAKDVALVWRSIIDDMDTWGCGGVPVQIRACASPSCGLEYSTDGGVTWHCVDLASCIETIWDEKLAQAFDMGVLGKGVSTPGSPQSRPAALTCRTFHVRLQGNGIWTCPFPISTGDTIQISNATGGWWDGEALAGWYCPDGKMYAFGACGIDAPAKSADPLQSVNHMRLVGHVTTGWFDALAGLITIPNGNAQQQLTIQANDSPIDDNAGEIAFDIEVCAAEAISGCFVWDYTISEHNWQIINIPGTGTPAGAYSDGQGWNTTAAFGEYYLSMDTTAGLPSFTFDDMYVDIYNPTASNVSGYIYISNQGGSLKNVPCTIKPGENTIDAGWSSTWGAGNTLIIVLEAVTASCTLRRIRFIGCTAQPTGTDEC